MSDVPPRLATALADRYRIERPLGEGGMATVYLAEDLKHQRRVAIKVLKPELAAVLGAERFVQEITTTAQLQHPHILPLFDSGAADGFLFYVMPYVEGETLRDRMNREKHLSVEEGVRIAREVADALDYAHRRGVIHRDTKPENILLQYERMAVLAMGLDQRPVTVDTLFLGNGFTWPSADGRWVAYTNSGWTEAWIEALPGDGRRFQVAAGNLADLQWLSAFELGVPITDGSRTRVERVTLDPSADPPVMNRGWWADATEFRDTNGPSFATAPGGGLMYLQGAAARPASYLRVVPGWVAQMKRAVDEANR